MILIQMFQNPFRYRMLNNAHSYVQYLSARNEDSKNKGILTRSRPSAMDNFARSQSHLG